MNLELLAKCTDYSEQDQEYFLSFLKEIEALEFVQALCEEAYQFGCDEPR